jgi:hypothetical protein
VTASGKRNENVKVALNSNQVKSLQAGVHADGGGLNLVNRNRQTIFSLKRRPRLLSPIRQNPFVADDARIVPRCDFAEKYGPANRGPQLASCSKATIGRFCRGGSRSTRSRYDFQAPGSYEKAGFRRMAEFEGWPDGHVNVVLCKTL